MPAGKKRETIKQFGKFLKSALSQSKTNPTSSGPASSHPQSPTPCTNAPSNVTSGSPIAASSSAAKTTGSQSTLPGPAHAGGAQSLNPPPPATPVPAKNEAFEKAIMLYINQLTEADKKAFLDASSILDRLKETQNDQSGSGGKSRTPGQFTDRLQKALQCVQRFMGSIVVSIGHHPQISSLVVGGFNCILTVGTFLMST